MPAPVVRTEWEQDGSEWLGGSATRLEFVGAIFVELRDARCSIIGA